MNSLVAQGGRAVKRRQPQLRPIGELVALFPEGNPERFLHTFDYYALSLIEVQKLTLAADCGLPTPPRGGRTRWMGVYRVILGVEVDRD